MSLPSYELEARASEQRKQLHLSLKEFRTRLRQHNMVKPVLRKYLAHAAGAATLFGLLVGYSSAGPFSGVKR